MITLKTKTAFQVPTKRGVINAIVYLKIEFIFIDRNNVISKGFYYYIDINNNIVKLDDSGTTKQWKDVAIGEAQLPVLSSSTSLYANIIQRLSEFTFAQLVIEDKENYGTSASDWKFVI